MEKSQPDPSNAIREVIEELTQAIGPRGSCTPSVEKAGRLIWKRLEALGVTYLQFIPFHGFISTYQPFVRAFIVAVIGSFLALAVGIVSRFLPLSACGCSPLINQHTPPWLFWSYGGILFISGMLNFSGTWAMFAESEFLPHWARKFSSQKSTQNLLGVIPALDDVRHRVILCAHLDTHRTPVFYSNRRWQSAFGPLVALALISMLLAGLAFALGGLSGLLFLTFFPNTSMDWAGFGLAASFSLPIQGLVLFLLSRADFTPFSPGADDDASGVGVIVGIAEYVVNNPLAHTEVRLLFTDNEETGAWGMRAYLTREEPSSPDEVFIILDQVGNGKLKILTTDGLILKTPTHPKALELARLAIKECPFEVLESPGLAYTDALPATKDGRVALTICDEPDPVIGSRWHQLSDLPAALDDSTLNQAFLLTHRILQIVDSQP